MNDIPTGDAEKDDRDELIGAAIDPNIHPEAEAIWRDRAKAYNSQYLGPAHWRTALNIVAATGSISMAIKAIGVSYKNFKQRRERYVEFGEQVDQALEYFNHATLERAAVARAVDGVLEPVWHKGEHVGFRRVYSDGLLTKLLEANMPGKYKPKLEVQSGPISVHITGGLPEDKPIGSPPSPGTADEAAEPPASDEPPADQSSPSDQPTATET